MSGKIVRFIKNAIARDKVVMFSKINCPHCEIGKQQFDKVKIAYVAVEIEGRTDCNKIQEVLKQMTGDRSVPRIFVDGKCVGGAAEAKKLIKSGSLAKMLQTEKDLNKV